MERLHLDGIPLHVRKPELSVFKVLAFSEFEQLSVKEVQNMLRTQHLLLTNEPSSRLEFNMKGLRTLRNASNTVTIQGEEILNLCLPRILLKLATFPFKIKAFLSQIHIMFA